MAIGPDEAPPITTTPDARRRHAVRRDAWFAAATVAVVVAGVALGAVALRPAGQAAARTTDAVPGQPFRPGVDAAALARYRWRTLPKAPIQPRGNAATVWTGRVLIVWGGSAGNRTFDDGAMYDPARRHWTRLPAGPLSARTAPAVAWVDGAFLVWGGNSGLADGARYDVASRRWSVLPKPADDAPSRSAVLVVRGRDAYLIRAPLGDHDRRVRIDRYSPGDHRWTGLPTLRTAAKHDVDQIDALAIKGEVLVWAYWSHTVQTSPGSTETSAGVDAERFDLRGRAWASLDPAGSGLSAAGAQLLDGEVLLPQDQRWCGPCSGPPVLNITGALIDPRTGRRTTVPPSPAGFGGQFRSTGSTLLVLNPNAEASGPSGTRPGDLAVWDPRSRQWTRLAPAPARLRDEVNVVWAGDRLLAWGGDNSPTPASDGLEYAPPHRREVRT